MHSAFPCSTAVGPVNLASMVGRVPCANKPWYACQLSTSTPPTEDEDESGGNGEEEEEEDADEVGQRQPGEPAAVKADSAH